jgi:hypothetical protein
MLAMWPLAGVRAGNTTLTVDSGEARHRWRGRRGGKARGSRGQPSGGFGWSWGGLCGPAHGEAEAAAGENGAAALQCPRGEGNWPDSCARMRWS